MRRAEEEEATVIVERIELREAAYHSVSDAERVSYVQKTMSDLRRLVELEYDYDEIGSLTSFARSKANLPHPTVPRTSGVGTEPAANTPTRSEVNGDEGDSGVESVPLAADGRSTQVPAEDVASEAVSEGDESADSPSS